MLDRAQERVQVDDRGLCHVTVRNTLLGRETSESLTKRGIDHALARERRKIAAIGFLAREIGREVEGALERAAGIGCRCTKPANLTC